MEEILLGTRIRNQREALRMSQEELCEGCCSLSNLSRIENNQQIPSHTLAKTLLERLGLADDLYTAILDQKATTERMLMREISNDTLRHRRASKVDQPQIRQQIQAKLVELEEIVKANDQTAQQFLLSQRALWGRPDYSYSTEEKLSMQLDAIRLTHPRFDPENFQHGHYSMHEAEVIIQIARAHSILGQRKRAIDIYSQLLWNIEKNNKNLSGYASLFCLIAHNYAINLGLEKQYAEAIRISVQGENTCIYYGNYQFLPGFLSIQAECCHFLGDDEKSRELYFSAYYVYKAYRDPLNCENVRREVETYLGIDLPK